MDITDAHLRTNKTSSRVAPAAIADRIWRRIPSGLRCAPTAFKPTQTSSMNLRGKTPLVQGLVVIFTHCSAQAGSHSRSLFSAASQGLIERPFTESSTVPLLVTIFFFFLLSLHLLPAIKFVQQ